MKKCFITLLILAAFSAKAQNTTIEYLDINNVKAGILNRGDMFWNPNTSNGSYEFPKGSGKNSNFAGNLWVSGINKTTNQLHISAQTYRQNGSDYWSGPLDSLGTIDPLTSEKWDKIWKVDKATIDLFIITSPHTIANTPAVILQWPAKGNINALGKNGASITANKNLAPFVDINNDGIYNALDGDFPKLKGEQMLWWVFNDNGQSHDETNGKSLKIEVQAMAYACNSIPILDNAIYVDYKVVSYSSDSFMNSRFSIYNDFDLGYPYDDFIGYDSTRRMGICYNGTNFDQGVNGYGYNMTQIGCIVLKSPNELQTFTESLGGAVFYDNNNDVTGNPDLDTGYNHYMNNKWKDSKPFTDTCNARLGANVVNFVYPSEPNDSSGWSERQCANVPGDRRILLNSGSFTIIPGTEYKFNIAFVNTPTGSSNVDFSILKGYADTVIQYANGCSTSFPLSTVNHTRFQNIELYPNPARTEIEIKGSELFKQKINRIEIYAPDGKMITEYDKNQILNKKINIQHLPNGLYFMKIMSKDKIATQKFLKN